METDTDHGQSISDREHASALEFRIDPIPGETRRACVALGRAVLPPDRSVLVLIGVYVAVGLAAYFLTPATRPMTAYIGIVAAAVTAYGLRAYGRARLRRLLSDDPQPAAYVVALSADGVHTWSKHVDAHFPWREIARVAEDNEFYLFARTSGTGAAIPKRLLDDALEARLRGCIAEWAPDHGAGLPRVSQAPRRSA